MRFPCLRACWPLRILYDTLISDKVYKSGVNHDRNGRHYFQGRESHFDDTADAFMDIQDQFADIAQKACRYRA